MMNTSVRPTDSIEQIMKTYGNMLYRICLATTGNESDAEDAVQETMLKYIRKTPQFEDSEHEKAWLIRVAVNKCRDIIRYRKRHPTADMEEAKNLTDFKEESGILDILRALPEKYRTVLELYYVEEYNTSEIAEIIGKTTSAVKMRLQKGRKLLADAYRKECL